jgi:hypothetical protein
MWMRMSMAAGCAWILAGMFVLLTPRPVAAQGQGPTECVRRCLQAHQPCLGTGGGEDQAFCAQALAACIQACVAQ